jgi:hypothetical protein
MYLNLLMVIRMDKCGPFNNSVEVSNTKIHSEKHTLQVFVLQSNKIMLNV